MRVYARACAGKQAGGRSRGRCVGRLFDVPSSEIRASLQVLVECRGVVLLRQHGWYAFESSLSVMHLHE